jgi:hypothetical protein
MQVDRAARPMKRVPFEEADNVADNGGPGEDREV